jgi:hypothetical protein
MELVILAAGVLAILGAVGWHAFETVWSRRLMLRRRVLVSLTSGRAVTGVMWTRRGRLLVLKDAQLHEQGADPAGMDGDVVIDRDLVEYVQAAG